MKTLAAIANGYSDNLITRAADITIKEKRRLILIVRESPLSPIHLENMLKLARLGVVIAPPVPSYYIMPESVEELIDHTVGRILDQIGIESEIKRWGNK
jgi:4-hydroxy-3-polyprenylbenzoate decarboxylase